MVYTGCEHGGWEHVGCERVGCETCYGPIVGDLKAESPRRIAATKIKTIIWSRKGVTGTDFNHILHARSYIHFR